MNFGTQVKKVTVADEQDSGDNLNSYANLIADSMHCAVKETLPLRTAIPKRPCIRNGTLELINLRNKTRVHRRTTLEATLNSAIKKSAKADRRDWLDGMVHTGDWSGIKLLRRGRLRRQGRLRNQEGNLVASDMRAQTMAD